MRKFFKSIWRPSFIGTLLAYPKSAALASMVLLGAGGAGIVAIVFTTPTIVPQASSYFNQNAASGRFQQCAQSRMAASTPAQSNCSAFPRRSRIPCVLYVEGSVNRGARLLHVRNRKRCSVGGTLSRSLILTGTQPASRRSWSQRNLGGGVPGSQWWNAVSTNNFTGSITAHSRHELRDRLLSFHRDRRRLRARACGVRQPNGTAAL